MKTLVSLISLFLLYQNYAFANQLKEIRKIYYTNYDLIKKNKVKKHYFVNRPDDEENWDLWKKVPDFNNIKLGDSFSIMLVTVNAFKGEIINIETKFETRSGDWVNTTNYYFYDNGKVAFIFESHFTFLGLTDDEDKGPFTVEKRLYFDKKSKLIKKLEKAIVNKSKKIVSASKIQQIEQDYFMNIQSLPFKLD